VTVSFVHSLGFPLPDDRLEDECVDAVDIGYRLSAYMTLGLQ
jgi:hypothetical protein